MKVSEITVDNVADFLRLESTDSLLTPILTAAKKYIESYTGIYKQEIADAYTGDGESTAFKASKYPFVASTLKVKTDGTEGTLDTDYLVDSITGKITFTTAPSADSEITFEYEYSLDAFDEFWIAVMILCQDMYDNRILSVENENVNVVVSSILDMHRTNLLPKGE